MLKDKLVVKEYSQKCRIDYEEVFAHVAHFKSIFMMIAR